MSSIENSKKESLTSHLPIVSREEWQRAGRPATSLTTDEAASITVLVDVEALVPRACQLSLTRLLRPGEFGYFGRHFEI